jgi:hypothetical protein
MENVKRLLRKLIQFELEAINNISIAIEEIQKDKNINQEITNKLNCAMEAHKIQCGNISNILDELETPVEEPEEEPEDEIDIDIKMTPDYRLGNNYGDIEPGVDNTSKYTRPNFSSFEHLERNLDRQLNESIKKFSKTKHK